MKPGTPAPGDQLIQVIANRVAAQAAHRHEARRKTSEALAKFLQDREEAQSALTARLEKINVSPAKGFWPFQQKRVNQQLSHSSQQLTSLLQQMLKEQKKTTRETAKLLKLLMTLSDDEMPESDSM